MRTGAWLGVVFTVTACGDARSTVTTAVLAAARASPPSESGAPVIPVRLPPFEIPPPSDPIVALHGDCVTRKSGAVTCWGEPKPPPDDAPAIRCQLPKNHHVTCTAPGSRRPREVAELVDVSVFAMGGATGERALACAVHGDGAARSAGVGDARTVDRWVACYDIVVEVDGIAAYARDDDRLAAAGLEAATALAVSTDGSVVAGIVEGRVVVHQAGKSRTVPRLVDAVALTDHCALRAQGSVVCWGDHDLGQKKVARADTPGPVVGVANVLAVASGTSTGWAVTRSGRLYRWGGGRGWARVVDEIRDATGVAVASEYTYAGATNRKPDTACVVRRTGRVSCVDAALQITDLDLEGGRAVTIAGGTSGFVIGMADGTVRAVALDAESATRIDRIANMAGVVEVAGEASYACARTHDGVVWCSAGGFEASQIPSSGAIEIVGTDGAACARSATGSVACWRDLVGWRTGAAPVTDGAVALSAGRGGLCAAHADGSLDCWQGHPDSPMTARPVLPAGSVGVVISGAEDGCTIAVDRRVLCWGDNRDGRLGDGSVFQLDTPAGVPL